MTSVVQTHSCIQWSEEESDHLAKTGGHSKYSYSDTCVYIGRIRSDKKGFGTALMRKVVKVSLEAGFGGNVELKASWSAHLFWLYMGMIPKERPVHIVTVNWGLLGQDALNNLPVIKKQILNENLSSIDIELDIIVLKKMVATIKNVSLKDVTAQMIVDSEEELNDLNKKEGSYIKDEFIPRILKILEENLEKSHPDTSRLGGVDMILSEQGLIQWKDAIENQKPFVSFKKLEHLRSLMNEEQIKQLDTIMLIR